MNATQTADVVSARTENPEQVIEINNLRKGFGTEDVLVDVSLKLFNGENLVVLGKSGSGKSVLIKCIVRLLDPDDGTINVLGEDLSTLDQKGLGELRKRIGFLFQSGALYDSMTVKRISLARTLVVDPRIMLYDEPTTGLDPVTSDEISMLINDVQKKYKTSSIIITHDIECARTTANRIIMLLDGEVYKVGGLDEFEKSADPSIKSFFK